VEYNISDDESNMDSYEGTASKGLASKVGAVIVEAVELVVV